MLRSLSSRLLLAFAFVIVLSLALSAVGTLFLLRDRQQDAAEERVGRLAEPITLAIALLEEAGAGPVTIQNAIVNYAISFDVRVLLLDDSNRVVVDTESLLTGRTVDSFSEPGLPVIKRKSAEFRMVSYDAEGEDLLLFAPAQESIEVSSDRIFQLQTVIFELAAADSSPEEFDTLLEALLVAPDVPGTLPLPSLRPLVAVPKEQVVSAWRDLIPQLSIAGGIALLASVAAAVLISRSVSGRLARVTRAAQEMSRGQYEQRLDPRGEDEVGRLARAFNDMAQQVATSHRMMRDLLANVSHELKTPLTSLQGFSQAMEEGMISSPEDYQKAGRIINEETQRMRILVDDLIELSRLESGEAVVQRDGVDMEKLLRTCARRFDWQLQESETALRLDVPTLPNLDGDERRLEQVFTNLIDNAVRHAPKGGSVTVRAEAENGVLRVAVHNTGSYIPPDELSRVFERFFQLDRSRKGKGVGSSGLGLAIVSEVVLAHSGDVSASSDREAGTEFVVTLPVAASKGATSRSED